MDRPEVGPESLPADDGERLEQFARRRAFLQLDAEDAARLRSMLDEFIVFADRFVAGFYDHLGAHEETAAFLQDPERIARLKQLQREHFDSLLEADWGLEYLEHRRRVGARHEEVGLPPDLFLGAYAQYVQFCFRNFVHPADEETREYVERMLSLIKVIFLDVGLTLDSYFEQATLELRRALEMYWKSTVDLRQFAQLTSHDLKTPLATVANLCEEVLDEFGDQIPAEARELIDAARRRTFQTSRMIDELLESTLSFQSTEACDVVRSEELFREAAERLEATMEEKRIHLELPEQWPAVWGNQVRLREAIYNLLANAVKYIDKSRGSIVVTVRREPDRVLFSIEDNGPGIPADEWQRIFVPFRRLHQHRDVPGSGLGLYFAKQLIEEAGGRIWVDSTLGRGSVFYVALKPC